MDAQADSASLGRIVNHSLHPNATVKAFEVDGLPRLALISTKNISVGEEITFNYGVRDLLSLHHNPWLAEDPAGRLGCENCVKRFTNIAALNGHNDAFHNH